MLHDELSNQLKNIEELRLLWVQDVLDHPDC